MTGTPEVNFQMADNSPSGGLNVVKAKDCWTLRMIPIFLQDLLQLKNDVAAARGAPCLVACGHLLSVMACMELVETH